MSYEVFAHNVMAPVFVAVVLWWLASVRNLRVEVEVLKVELRHTNAQLAETRKSLDRLAAVFGETTH